MQITAKFSSTCPACGDYINAGDQVEWTKGTKARHVSCGGGAKRSKTPPATQPKPAVPSVADAPYVRAEKWDPCKRSALPDTTGDVRVVGAFKRSWASLRDGAAGEPVLEGDALVVVAQTAMYESAEQNEDMGDMSGPGWHVTLYLRRATAEEAAPAFTKAGIAKAKKDAIAVRTAQINELKKILREGWATFDNDVWQPVGTGRVVLEESASRGAIEFAFANDDGDAIGSYHCGYYDDYRPSLRVTRDPRAVVIFSALQVRLLP